MITDAICTINGAQIQVSRDEQQLVPIKPICDALGIASQPQIDKLKSDPILGSTTTLSIVVGADGKQREMTCIPLKYIYGWLFTINPKNVSEEARPAVTLYRMECYDALYDHFNKVARRVTEENRAEIQALEDIARLTQEQSDIKGQLSSAKKRLEDIRASRLDPRPSLFD